jgi:hypothetical protein
MKKANKQDREKGEKLKVELSTADLISMRVMCQFEKLLRAANSASL